MEAQLYFMSSGYLSNVAKSAETPKIGAKRFEFCPILMKENFIRRNF